MRSLWLFSVAVSLAAQTADLVVVNARIYTVNPTQPTASALAVKGGRLLAVGDDVSAYVNAATKRIDAKGATIIPGLIDAHVHMRGLGDSLEILDLRSTRSPQEAAGLVRTAAGQRTKGEWIRGRAWDQTEYPGKEFPSKEVLDRAAPDHPVYLTRVDGHAAWVNQKALDLADVNSATKDPDGGKIIRDAKGAPTGILIDRAQNLVRSRIPAATQEQVRRLISRAVKECARLGLTGVHDAGVGQEDLLAYRSLEQSKELTLRVYAMIGGEGALWREYLKKGPEIGEVLTVRSIKLVADGALGSRGAALLEPYSDEPNNAGLLILKEEDIRRVARDAVARGFQVNTHAIGDRANRVTLQAYGSVLIGKNNRRFRIEHSQIVAMPDFELFRRASVIASIQATHATSDMRWAESRIGPARVKGAYAWRKFLDMGIPIANGSDFPVENANPLWGVYSSVTRQDHAGSPAGGWYPDQKLTRAEALKSFTLDAAFAAFEEKQKGSLEAGKLADFVMLSSDIMRVPPAEILKTKVLMTVVGGAVVYNSQ